MRMQSVRNNKGFSLVELMVVVAIIGILAAVAVPNFQRFSAKSKQAEAKSNLSMVYTGNQAFKEEWGSYTGDMNQMGANFSGVLNYRIQSANFNGTPATGYTGTAFVAANIVTPASCLAATGCQENAGAVAGKAGAVAVTKAAAAVTASTYLIGASGVIVAGGVEDCWAVDQLKVFHNGVGGGQSGLP